MDPTRLRTTPSCPAAALALALAAPAVAQTDDDGGLWTVFLGQGSLRAVDPDLERWRWWLDVQVRQRDEGEHLEQFLFRPGLGYMLDDRFGVWAGYGVIATDPVGGDEWVEHRAWQQTTWRLPVEGVSLAWRNRLEQRFFEIDADTGWRLRELLRLTVPLSADGALYAAAWDEVFFDLNDTNRVQRAGCRQNRAFVGLGYHLDEARHSAVEVGYLNQWIDQAEPRPDRMNHILSVSFLLNL